MPTYYPIEGFEREELYRHFSRSWELHPVGCITVRLNCTALYHDAKQKGHSFFLRYAHATLRAINEIKNFKYRLSDRDRETEYILFDTLHISVTVARPDHSFGFAYFNYEEDYEIFEAEAQKSIEAVKQEKSLRGDPRKDLIYMTVVRDIDFTSLKFTPSPALDIPHVGFGKVVDKDGQKEMSMAIQYLHAFQDGYHVGLLINKMQSIFDESL